MKLHLRILVAMLVLAAIVAIGATGLLFQMVPAARPGDGPRRR